ncbi:putative alternative oxidase AlxA [Talaromyces proteolyticus]|uniref:Alternative oxidase n=1 Tax=Talaromyces proteolyticus TaxID=1131652 RepID=A0AAD4L0H2_9EURO|nr:putative alternative oxidase AlxA [Talaromyces proteolyticus]KAH8704804.1 putative alternative oxidase AlxA [Talaromyces proteolyticus]
MYSITTTPIRVTASALPKTAGLRGCIVAASYSSLTSLSHKPAHTPYHTHRSVSSTTPQSKIKEFFPKVETKQIVEVESAWRHPVYTEAQMRSIQVSHRQARNWSDWFALAMARVLRWGMDTVTNYKHPSSSNGKFEMTEKNWLNRILFLESVAGVPGMVAGMLRHLRSLRTMKRDNGWIETLLEEAHNERMHLLTFMKIAQPGLFMRLMVLGAQGVYFNGLFFAYLISPRTCHRFVGYLEEEAVITYTRIIEEIEAGHLPAWREMQAPEIAVKYWDMPEGSRSMRDLMLYVRADEAKHREVNHTLGNLDQKADPNPYTAVYRDSTKLKPSKGADLMKETGWEREEVI